MKTHERLKRIPLYVWIPAAMLALLIAWRIYTKHAQSQAMTAAQQARLNAPPVVNVTPTTVRDVVNSFEAVGSVEAPFNVKISSTVTGTITYLQVREGDSVKKGDVLVRIDPSAVQAEVNQARSALATAQARYAQALATQNTNDVSVTSQVLQAQAAVATAEAEHNQVRQSYVAQLTDAAGKVNIAQAAVSNAQASRNNASARYNRVLELRRQGYVTAQDVDDARTAYEVQSAQVQSAQAQRQSAISQQAIVRNKSRADLATAQARVVQARATLTSARANTSQVSAYQQNLAALHASVDAAEAAVRNAQARLEFTILRSSIDGYVTARQMDPGAVATPGQQILAIQSIDPLWVTIPVPEEVNRQVYMHQPSTVALDALPGKQFKGHVVNVNAAADPTNRHFLVRVKLDNPQRVVKPGMFAHVQLTIGRVPRALVVQREAVLSDRAESENAPEGKAGDAARKRGSYVFVIDGNSVAHRRPVVLGESDAKGFEVKSGLQPGERVVIMSGIRLRDGQTVRVVSGDGDLGKKG